MLALAQHSLVHVWYTLASWCHQHTSSAGCLLSMSEVQEALAGVQVWVFGDMHVVDDTLQVLPADLSSLVTLQSLTAMQL